MEGTRLNSDRWKTMSFIEQMANIGSEVGRTLKWVLKDKPAMAQGAYVRALELIDLTIEYGRYGSPFRTEMLKELSQVRECFCSAYEMSDTATLTWLDKYFGDFAVAHRRQAAS